MSEAPNSNKPEVEFVGFWYRLGAFLWDVVIQILMIAVISGAFLLAAFLTQSLSRENWLEPSLPMLGVIQLMVIVCYQFMSWLLFGRSLGKWLCSQRIVSMRTGQRPGPWQCLLRFVTYPTGLLIGWLLFRHPQRRALHDRIAGTCVIADASMRYAPPEEQAEYRLAYQSAPWLA